MKKTINELRGLNDVIHERNKQIALGFDKVHDSRWGGSQLPLAALNYLGAVVYRRRNLDPTVQIDKGGVFTGWWKWPWDRTWWKPQADREDLVRAAALIIAEIDRIDSL